MFSKLSIAFVAALAVVTEAKHKNHALHHRASNNSTTASSSLTVAPIPLSTSAVAPAGTNSVSSDITLTYTLGTGTSTSVVTTVISAVSIEPRHAMSYENITPHILPVY